MEKAISNDSVLKENNKPKCFIIMPFGGWYDTYYFDIYIPAIENAGFNAKRADDLYSPGNIVNDIWNFTKEATVLLADLTNKNPNVFYELGLAHALTKPVILITASMEDIPFDLRSLRVIEYDKNSPNWGEILQNKITKALTETKKNPKKAIPPTFFEIDKIDRLKVTPENKEIMELRSDLDLLKREILTNNIRTNNRNRNEDIKPDEADLLIRNYINRGIDEIIIAEKLEPLGPPKEWTYKRIASIKNEIKLDDL